MFTVIHIPDRAPCRETFHSSVCERGTLSSVLRTKIQRGIKHHLCCLTGDGDETMKMENRGGTVALSKTERSKEREKSETQGETEEMKRESQGDGAFHHFHIQVTSKCSESPEAKSGPGPTAKSDNTPSISAPSTKLQEI
ncbi:unnamed protein product [Pleuronectes platessa]|uniref:Uncharacterized protein n=1 Tax=Pleuronectes platessa TaxID=8262 RepID=A0A9N7UBZ2_PLEPL|nr:unnamed protein product [Pleuronectes platessa]